MLISATIFSSLLIHFSFLYCINTSYKFELKEVQLVYMRYSEMMKQAEYIRDTMYKMMDLGVKGDC
ncbi:MAG: hypothetical protein B6D54_01515 [Epsilonproteobacteria bacterium 4484_65]|nr:MAG: hypothetical protein B6D54_01515 [Epsilonproteobacteria bacterium 4484_65]